MNNNRCLYCNEIIPEGSLVCPTCEIAQTTEGTKNGMILQSINATEKEVEVAYNFMEGNDDR